MARLITKFKYLKNDEVKKIGGYAKYIAVREGVEKIDESFKLVPATLKQGDIIKKLLKDFPDAKDMHEYDDYCKNPTKWNASEFISRVVEENIETAMGKKTYADYIATRPRAERFGSHGLFTDDGEPVNLNSVSAELNDYGGNVWTVILSLRREDAQRLGYDNGTRWRDMLRSEADAMAENFKIPLDNFCWYGAFHNEGHHPHVHLIVYSKNPKEGYLTKQSVHNLRSAFATKIFAQDLVSVYEKQTQHRDELRGAGRDLIAEIVKRINEDGYDNPVLEQKLVQLAKRLSKTKGKKVYGYLKPDVKALVCSIVDGLASDERIAKLYELWYEQREEVIKTYTKEMGERVPLSQNDEFKSIRNAVIKEAMNILLERKAMDRECPTPEPTDEETERKISWKDKKKMWELYRKAKDLLDETSDGYNPSQAVEFFIESAGLGNTVAKYSLGKMYLTGKEIPKDTAQAQKWLEDSVSDGNEYAEYLLGKTLLKGEDFAFDGVKAEDLLRRAIGKGNKYAAYTLGKALLDGEKLKKNTADAVEFLKQSAEKGMLPAEYVYGKLLYQGELIEKDTAKALEYLERAAGKGNEQAAYLAGKICMSEEGLKDIEKAVWYLEMAARKGNDFAEFQLARIYLYGKDMPRDEEKAIAYLHSAAEKGNEYAKQTLENIREHRNQYMATGVIRLFYHLSRIMQDKLEDKKRGQTDRKLLRQIDEKKRAHGLKHEQ